MLLYCVRRIDGEDSDVGPFHQPHHPNSKRIVQKYDQSNLQKHDGVVMRDCEWKEHNIRTRLDGDLYSTAAYHEPFRASRANSPDLCIYPSLQPCNCRPTFSSRAIHPWTGSFSMCSGQINNCASCRRENNSPAGNPHFTVQLLMTMTHQGARTYGICA